MSHTANPQLGKKRGTKLFIFITIHVLHVMAHNWTIITLQLCHAGENGTSGATAFGSTAFVKFYDDGGLDKEPRSTNAGPRACRGIW